MEYESDLNSDQIDRIRVTLERIREGLSSAPDLDPAEPAHIFEPETLDDQQS